MWCMDRGQRDIYITGHLHAHLALSVDPLYPSHCWNMWHQSHPPLPELYVNIFVIWWNVCRVAPICDFVSQLYCFCVVNTRSSCILIRNLYSVQLHVLILFSNGLSVVGKRTLDSKFISLMCLSPTTITFNNFLFDRFFLKLVLNMLFLLQHAGVLNLPGCSSKALLFFLCPHI